MFTQGSLSISVIHSFSCLYDLLFSFQTMEKMIIGHMYIYICTEKIYILMVLLHPGAGLSV